MNGQNNLFHKFSFPWCLVPKTKREGTTSHQAVKHLTRSPEMYVFFLGHDLSPWGSSVFQDSQVLPCQLLGEKGALILSVPGFQIQSVFFPMSSASAASLSHRPSRTQIGLMKESPQISLVVMHPLSPARSFLVHGQKLADPGLYSHTHTHTELTNIFSH